MTVLTDVDALLRGTDRFAPGTSAVPWKRLLVIGCAAGFCYGVAMGVQGGRPLQMLFSAIKVPILIFASMLICLPSFFVINTAIGLRDDFGAAFRGVLSAQGSVALCLAGLAPIALVGYASSPVYGFALAFNGALFALASLAGQATLARHYRPLIARDPRHWFGLCLWLALYWFVTIQLAWMLRPFVGAPGQPTLFLRPDSWGNAYVEITDLLARWLSR